MRRLVAGLAAVVTASSIAGLPTVAGAATNLAVRSSEADRFAPDPAVGFTRVPDPWWVVDAQRKSPRGAGTTTLYLGPGTTPARGPAIAVSTAYDGAGTICGAPVALGVAGGALEGANVVRAGPFVAVTKRVEAPDAFTLVLSLLARDLSDADAVRIAEAATRPEDRSLRIAPPPGWSRVAEAPLAFASATGPGSSVGLHFGWSDERGATIASYRARGRARSIETFWRHGAYEARCDPGRVAVRAFGPTTAIVTSSDAGDAARLSDALVGSGPAGWAELVRGARHPSISEFARRCRDVGVVTISGRHDGRVWTTGQSDNNRVCAVTELVSSSMGTSTPGIAEGPISLDVARNQGCTAWVVAGRMPAAATRLTVRSGKEPTVDAHLRTVHWRADGPARGLFAAAVPTPDQDWPGFVFVARGQEGKVLARLEWPPGRPGRCHRGERSLSG